MANEGKRGLEKSENGVKWTWLSKKMGTDSMVCGLLVDCRT